MYIPPSSVTSYLRFSSVLFFVNLALCLASAMPMDGYSGLTSFLFLGTKRGLSNLQMFTAALGGIIAAPITMSTNAKRPYEVDGDTFPDFATAASRSCDVQHNSCCDAANAKKGNFTTNDCDTQLSQCTTAQENAAVQSFSLEDVGPDPNDPNFELFCEP